MSDTPIEQQICRIGETAQVAERKCDLEIASVSRNLVGEGIGGVRKLIHLKERQSEMFEEYIEICSGTSTSSRIKRRLQRLFFPGAFRERMFFINQLRHQISIGKVEAKLLTSLRDSLNEIQNSWNVLQGLTESVDDSGNDLDSASPLRVLVDLRQAVADGGNGGLQVYVEWLIRWCRENARQRIEFVAVASLSNWQYVARLFGKEDTVVLSGESNRVISERGTREAAVVSTTLEMDAVARNIGVDLLYCPLQNFPFPDSEIPSVVLLVDLLHKEFPSALSDPECERRDAFFREATKSATRIQCISDSSQKLLEKHFPEAEGKTFRTYLPIQGRLDADGSEAGNIGPAVELAISEAPYFFYPANLWPHKNHDTLLEALAIYSEKCEGERWNLILTGADSVGRKSELEKASRELGIDSTIHILGYVSADELNQIWHRASALVFPSLHEGFGIPLLEAMGCGVPILCSDCYSLSEVAGDAALYFNPESAREIADRMCEIRKDRNLGKKLVEAGRNRLNVFDANAEAQKLLIEFENLAVGARS